MKNLNIKNMLIKKIILSFFFLFIINELQLIFAQLELNPIFSHNMILQRGNKTRIFGTCQPYTEVKLIARGTWQMSRPITDFSDESGHWEILLPYLEADDSPFQLLIKSLNKKISLKNIIIGDIWLASGQSNMLWLLGNIKPKQTNFPYANQIRLIKTTKLDSAKEKRKKINISDAFQKSWRMADKTFAPRISAAAYYFAEKYYQDTKVPVGIILAARGSTTLESWLPSGSLEKRTDWYLFKQQFNYMLISNKNKAERLRKQGKIQQAEHFEKDETWRYPGRLFNAQIAPIEKFTFKGMLWYQGENNANKYIQYSAIFPYAITEWRKFFDNEQMPFIFAQLPGFKGTKENTSKGKNWHFFRQAQAKALKLKNTRMVCQIDCGEMFNLHPNSKKILGKRFALKALDILKNERFQINPRVKTVTIKNNKAIIEFIYVGEGLQSQRVKLFLDNYSSDDKIILKANKIYGFKVCGKQKKFFPANAKIISKNKISVSSPSVEKIIHIRYGFEPFPQCNLYNSRNNPVLPFRTDRFRD